MKTTQYQNIRLTDSIERELLRDAIERNAEYELDVAIKNFFKKLATLLRAPEVRVHSQVRTAN